MEEWIEILKVKRRALDQMSYCDWKLNSIDEKVRNRAFSDEEEEMYRRLEEEKNKHRKIFNKKQFNNSSDSKAFWITQKHLA